MFPLIVTSTRFPYPSSGSRGISAPVPHLPWYTGVVRLLASVPAASVALATRYPRADAQIRSSSGASVPLRSLVPLSPGEPDPVFSQERYRGSPKFLGNPYVKRAPGKRLRWFGFRSRIATARCCLPPPQRLGLPHPNHGAWMELPRRWPISEFDPRGPLPRCLRFDTRRSPDEWQDSLPACLLSFDRTGFTPAGSH